MTKRLATACLLFSMLASACAQEHTMDLRCELRISSTLRADEPAQLVFTLTNAGSSAVHVLNWHTPFEGMKSAMFTVMRGADEVAYHGPMFKRGAPRREHYFALQPGERRETKIDLSEGWDVSSPGTYKIEYSAQLFDVASAESAIPRAIDDFTALTPQCNAASFTRGT